MIWLRSASMSVWILARSTFSSWAATILPLMSVRSSVTVSAAWRPTSIVEAPSDSDSLMPLKPFTSDCMTEEIAQTAALSFADPTFLPVEICS